MPVAAHASLPSAADAPFIRAFETWTFTPDRRRLTLAEGLYGDMKGFETASRDISFGYDEGLPGKAWALGRPIILTDLTSSYFQRGAEAAAAGLTCGVALPLFSGDFLTGVLVMFCGAGAGPVGAMELWRLPEEEAQMKLEAGWFGLAESFEFSARASAFGRGVGLPGKVWESGLPVLMSDLGRSRMFLRRDSAASVGLNAGIGIPAGRDGDQPCVLAFLSACGAPLARRAELWMIDETAPAPMLGLVQSMDAEPGAPPLYAHPEQRMDAGTVGAAWRAGAPVISRALEAEPPHIAVPLLRAGFTGMIALPVIAAGRCQAALAFYV